MKSIKYTFLLVITLSLTQTAIAQISTEGTDFWLGFMENWNPSPNNNPVQLEVYISSKDSTSGFLEIPQNSSFDLIGFNVVPDVATRIVIPTDIAMADGFGKVEPKGIHIKTEGTVSVYAMNKRQWSADISVILPTISLGKNYLVTAHWEPGTRNNGNNSNSEFLVVGVEHGTTVEIVPSVTTLAGQPDGVPFRIDLDTGEMYEVQARGDLTGTQVYAINNNGVCSDFALFAGNQYTKVGECNHPDGHDHLYAQMYPTNTWGQDFITVPFRTRTGGDLIKVMASENTTVLRINGDIIFLNKGEHINRTLTGVNLISADKPINVSQFSRSQACDNSTSDPFTFIVSPKEQLLREITFNAPPGNNLNSYYLNVLLLKEDLSNITLDGISVSSQFFPVPGDNDYMYAQIPINQGNHTLKSLIGFSAYVYGYGNNESFGFSTGTSLENLSLRIDVEDPDGFSVSEDDICWNTPLRFVPQTSRFFNQYIWDFGDGTSASSDIPIVQNHLYENPGTYIVSLIGQRLDAACADGGQEVSLKKITITRPEVEIFGPRSVCPNTPDVGYLAISESENTYAWDQFGGVGFAAAPDSLVVDWGGTNNDSFVSVLPTRIDGCVGVETIKPVRINIELDPEAPFGLDSLCSTEASDINYFAFETVGSTYDWDIEGGTIISGQNTASVQVDWGGHGQKKLWFYQGSTLDTVCGGGSDTVSVFVERSPSLAGELVGPDQVLVSDTFNLALMVDPLFKLSNWELDGRLLLDTVKIEPLEHVFRCRGTYEFSTTVFDTLGVCETTAQFTKVIHAVIPELEILNVTNEPDIDSTLFVSWKGTQLDNYAKPLELERKVNGEWEGLEDVSGRIDVVNSPLMTNKYAYSYKITIESDCLNPVATPEHQSMVARTDRMNEQNASFSWNEYSGWQNGVDKYEVWLKIDDQERLKLGEAQTPDFLVENTNEGFEYCLSVKAVELQGNNSYSWSNPTCASFIPEIRTYNVFSPNGDQWNQTFQIDNIERYSNSVLTVVNRYGKVVSQTVGYNNQWNGSDLPAGVYFWSLLLNEPRNPVEKLNGQLTILR